MKQNNIKIAITGGIGSGKSTVANIIASEGYPVFSCDEIYSELLLDGKFLLEIEKNFPGSVKDGRLDRNKLSAEVFKDEEKLKKLNALTHGKILSAAFKKTEGERLSFLEVPLLFENGFESRFDKVIVVLRDYENRISSVTVRDGISREEVINRIKRQFDYDKYDFAKYYVIHNNSNLADLRAKTLKTLCLIAGGTE